MKRIAVMQPYFFPYIGYFQLINAVDTFIILDDVHFIKRGWINRNRIIINDSVKYVTVPCKQISQNKLINQTEHNLTKHTREKILKKIKITYKKAPYFKYVYPLIEEVINSSARTISDIAIQSINKTLSYLAIKAVVKKSSESFENQGLRGAERIIDICEKENAKEYLNPEGGASLYSQENFLEHGIILKFLFSNPITYERFGNTIQKKLSIIDIMMFNSKETISEMLLNYHLD